MPFPFAIIGFDLDGTLLDTTADLAAAVNHALALAERAPMPLERIRPMIGGGARHMLDQALGATGGSEPALLDRLHPQLLAYYEAHIARHTRPFPYAVAAIDALRERGVACAAVTNKIERLTRLLLTELGLLDRFTCVLGGDSLGPGRGKPAPDLILAAIQRCGGGRAAFVGDSRYDVAAARAAGVPVVACAFEAAPPPEADAVITGFDQLIATLERLGAT